MEIPVAEPGFRYDIETGEWIYDPKLDDRLFQPSEQTIQFEPAQTDVYVNYQAYASQHQITKFFCLYATILIFLMVFTIIVLFSSRR